MMDIEMTPSLEDGYNKIMADPESFEEVFGPKASRKVLILHVIFNKLTVDNFQKTWTIVKYHYDLEDKWYFILLARNKLPFLLEDDFFKSQLEEMRNLIQAARASRDAERTTT